MKKILSISLAFILLLSNVGFTMATHFCGGLAVKSELMIGQGHLDCGMPDMDMEKKEHPEKGIFLKAKACCENRYESLEVDDEFQVSQERIGISLDFVATLVQTFINGTFGSETEKRQFTDYSPPLLLRDIPVLNQVFLI